MRRCCAQAPVSNDLLTTYMLCFHSVCCLHNTRAGKDCATLASINGTGACKPSDAATCAPYLSDASVLLSWKAALNDSQGRLTNWTGPDPCGSVQAWPGVRCSDDKMAVVAVNVSGFGLSGVLPGGLSQLTHLQVSSLWALHSQFLDQLQLTLHTHRLLCMLQ